MVGLTQAEYYRRRSNWRLDKAFSPSPFHALSPFFRLEQKACKERWNDAIRKITKK
jgi:hypothetical protein